MVAVFGQHIAQQTARGRASQREPRISSRDDGAGRGAKSCTLHGVAGLPVVMGGAARQAQGCQADDGNFSEAVHKRHGALLLLDDGFRLGVGHPLFKR